MKAVKWHVADNPDATRTTYHCYKPKTHKDVWSEAEYTGNVSLCHGRRFISEDGETPVQFEQLDDHGLNRNTACKKCLKIYDKETTNP